MKADWKPISTAPKDGTKIMGCEGSAIEPVVWEKEANYRYVDEPVLDKWGEETNYVAQGHWLANGLTSDEEDRTLNPTHWDFMPDLPQPCTP